MVLENTINSLKERPRDERKAIARMIAIAIIVILFLIWVVLFFKKIQNVEPIQSATTTEESIAQ